MFSKTTQYGSHMVTDNVTKELKIKYLNIDTRFSDDFSLIGSANYNIVLPDRLANIKSMAVTNIEIPMSFYNISAALGNNSFSLISIDPGSGAQSTILVVIPDGQYTTSSLQLKIQSFLPQDLLFSFNSSGHSVFTSTYYVVGDNIIQNSYKIVFYNEDVNCAAIKLTPKFKLGWMLGFKTLTSYMESGFSVTSDYPCRLSGGPKYLYLIIDEFQSGTQNSFVSVLSSSIIRKNILARVTTDYTVYPYGTILTANLFNGLLTTDLRSYALGGKIDLQKLNIQLVNENGEIMNLNGEDISFCLRLEYE